MDSYRSGTIIGDTSGISIQNKVYFNLFAKIEHNRLNKVYFPTRGTNVSGNAKLLLNNGPNPILIGDFMFKRARSVTDRITILYSINSRLIFGGNESFFHHTYIGGVQQTDYFDNAIPFNGLRRMEISTGSVGVGRLETRLKMWEKVYISATGDLGMFSEDNLFLTNQKTIYGFGLNAAYNSVVGPLEFNLSFSNYDHDVLPFLSLGFWF